MSSLSNYLENKLVDLLFRGQSYAPPATLHFALFTSAPTDSTAGTEVSGGGYARASVTASMTSFAGTQAAGSTSASTGSTGVTSNNQDIVFPNPTGNWGTIVAAGVFDAATGGNLLTFGPIDPNKTVNGGDLAPKFSSGEWKIEIDASA